MSTGSLFERPDRSTGPGFALEEIDDPASDSGPPISIRSLKSGMWRRRRLWLITAVAGMLLGASLHVIVPSKYVAVTRFYLVEPSAQAMSDDVSLIHTQTVVERAMATLRSNRARKSTMPHYKGKELSPSIMELRLSASSPAEAVTQSKAVAEAFLQVRSGVLNDQKQILVSRIQSQINALKTQIQQLTGQIDAFAPTPSGSPTSAQADLINQRNTASGQATQLQNQIQDEQNTEATISQGSRVLDPPIYLPASRKKVIVKDALSGLVAGLALGIILVVIGDLMSDRVRRRADVAAALGSPVELSVGHMPRPRWLAGPRLRSELKRHRRALRLVEHRLRDYLESSPSARLCLVEVEAAKPAALALTALAVSLSSEGKRVMLFDVADGRPLGLLLGRTATHEQSGTVLINGQNLTLFVAPVDPARMASMDWPEDTDVTLTLATVEPALGADHLSTSVSEVVVMIRAGATSAVHIDAVGQVLRQELIGVRSAVLIDADPDDHSSGLRSYRPADESTDDSLRTVKAFGR